MMSGNIYARASVILRNHSTYKLNQTSGDSEFAPSCRLGEIHCANCKSCSTILEHSYSVVVMVTI